MRRTWERIETVICWAVSCSKIPHPESWWVASGEGGNWFLSSTSFPAQVQINRVTWSWLPISGTHVFLLYLWISRSGSLGSGTLWAQSAVCWAMHSQNQFRKPGSIKIRSDYWYAFIHQQGTFYVNHSWVKLHFTELYAQRGAKCTFPLVQRKYRQAYNARIFVFSLCLNESRV